jgi:hypothetical protein
VVKYFLRKEGKESLIFQLGRTDASGENVVHYVSKIKKEREEMCVYFLGLLSRAYATMATAAMTTAPMIKAASVLISG